MTASNEKSIATLIHLSALSQYFIPFGNFIFPIIIWGTKKRESSFVDNNGKQVLNFQISMLIYSIILGLVAIPILIFTVLRNVRLHDFIFNHHHNIENFNFENITGLVITAVVFIVLLAAIKIAEFFITIYAAVKTSNGENFNYPLTISFFK